MAGKRKGLKGDRSSLFFEAMQIIRVKKPQYFIFENVKGVFSSNKGEDFTIILQEVAESGYDGQWQLLNTRWFLPQNRERVYFVGHLRGQCRPKIFPIGEDRREIDELRGKQPYTNCIAARYEGQGNGSYIVENKQEGEGKIRVKEATKKGYAEAKVGDSINFSVPSSETRRGRVGKGVAQTLDTASNQATINPNYSQKALNETLKKENLSENDIKALDLYNKKAKDVSPTLTEPHHNSLRLYEQSKIRRLTPTETCRLQGFPDNWNDCCSDTQRYKQMGNAVTVDVTETIYKKLYKESYESSVKD